MRTKDESFNKFYIYKTKAESQLKRKIKIIRYDRGDEYFTNQLVQYYEKNGIIHEETAPYSPQYNVIVERKQNGVLVDMVKYKLSSFGLLEQWWEKQYLHLVLF